MRNLREKLMKWDLQCNISNGKKENIRFFMCFMDMCNKLTWLIWFVHRLYLRELEYSVYNQEQTRRQFKLHSTQLCSCKGWGEDKSKTLTNIYLFNVSICIIMGQKRINHFHNDLILVSKNSIFLLVAIILNTR